MRALRILTILTVVQFVAVAFAQDAAAARKAIDARYAEYAKAIRAKNIKAIMALSTPDRTYKTKEGQVFKRADIERNISAQFQAIKSYDEVKFTIKDFKLNGKDVLATVTSTVKGKVIMSADGKKVGALATKTESRVTWVNTDKGWLMKKTEVLSDSQTLDGKPLVAAPAKGKPKGG